MIRLIPIEDRKTRLDRNFLKGLCNELKQTFNQECVIQRAMKPPTFARVAESDQFIGARLLEALPVENDKLVLGVTKLDLSMIGYDYTTGLADTPNRRAIISVSRLLGDSEDNAESSEGLPDRAIKRAIHELGHTLGLSHCENTKCVMNFSDSPEDMDVKSSSFCEECAGDLLKKVPESGG